jgi:6-phosphogluconolactonase/glucosamine-6-phosphate isomerase/deaminase
LADDCRDVYNLTMSNPAQPFHEFQAGRAKLSVYGSAASAGMAAAVQSAWVIRRAIEENGIARVRLEERVHPVRTHYLEGDASDIGAELNRYSQLLENAPIDVAFVGFGENGHIPVNDPPVADFNDPSMIKIITLDEACPRQQAGEGHFSDVAAVPKEAITITCTGLFLAKTWICCVPEERKAEAARNALTGPISEACPASLVRRHSNAFVYLDADSMAEGLSTRRAPNAGTR